MIFVCLEVKKKNGHPNFHAATRGSQELIKKTNTCVCTRMLRQTHRSDITPFSLKHVPCVMSCYVLSREDDFALIPGVMCVV